MRIFSRKLFRKKPIFSAILRNNFADFLHRNEDIFAKIPTKKSVISRTILQNNFADFLRKSEDIFAKIPPKSPFPRNITE